MRVAVSCYLLQGVKQIVGKPALLSLGSWYSFWFLLFKLFLLFSSKLLLPVFLMFHVDFSQRANKSVFVRILYFGPLTLENMCKHTTRMNKYYSISLGWPIHWNVTGIRYILEAVYCMYPVTLEGEPSEKNITCCSVSYLEKLVFACFIVHLNRSIRECETSPGYRFLCIACPHKIWNYFCLKCQFEPKITWLALYNGKIAY